MNLIILILVICGCKIPVASGINCYRCEESDPSRCTTPVECRNNEVCKITRSGNLPGGGFHYSFGCAAQTTCDGIAFGRRSTNLTKCCNTNLCNKKSLLPNPPDPTNEEGIACFVCNGADSLTSCHQVQKCNIGEYCYLEHVFDPIKNLKYYNGGCRAADICHLQQCADNVVHPSQTYCSKCCGSPLCNGKLCNIPTMNGTGVTLCFGCTNTMNPMACHETVRCEPNEECAINAKALHSLTYDLRCKPRRHCQQLGQVNRERQISIGEKCCNSTLCNDHYFDKDKNHHIVVLPEHYTCPPIPTTTAFTTTSTTVSTIQTTTTQVFCEDKPGVNCTELNTLNICDSSLARKYCARYCGHCRFSVGSVVG